MGFIELYAGGIGLVEYTVVVVSVGTGFWFIPYVL